jgi:hypothetical protein
MKAQRGSRSIALLFIEPQRYMGVGGQRHVPAALPPGRERPTTHCTGWPQSRSGRVRKISPSSGFNPQTVQPVASRCSSDYDISAHSEGSWSKINGLKRELGTRTPTKFRDLWWVELLLRSAQGCIYFCMTCTGNSETLPPWLAWGLLSFARLMRMIHLHGRRGLLPLSSVRYDDCF